MMDALIIGRYVPGQSLIHRFDPRAKLTVIFLFVFVVFLANNLYTYAILIAYTGIAVFLSKIPIRFIISGLRPILWIFLFTFLLHILTNKGGEVIVEIGWFSVYTEGLKQGIFISLRFFILITITTMLTLTTAPIAVTDGLEMMLAPFKRILPVHEIALMMSISLRFIPTLLQETDKIMKAQAARGIEFSSGPFKERLKAIVALLVPLFISSFKRAEDLAIAMEARGYQGGENRTKYRELVWKPIDTLLVCSLVALALILFTLKS